jgi:rhodanese-related sulfurtransferase
LDGGRIRGRQTGEGFSLRRFRGGRQGPGQWTSGRVDRRARPGRAQSVANTSFHLRTLATAGLVLTRRDRTRIYYRLASDRVTELWAALRGVAESHHACLDELAVAYLGDRSQLEQISRSELAERLSHGDAIVIDVRPAHEFDSGHIAGAFSIPMDQLERRLDDLPDGLEVVAYCRGPYCVFADDAVRMLTAVGRRARRLEDGYPEWRAEDRPVEVAAAS